MLAAGLRLALIALGSVIVVVLCLFGLRQFGLSGHYAPPHHEWFDRPDWQVVSLPADCQWVDLKKWPKLEPNQILKIQTQPLNNEWVVTCASEAIPLIEALERLPAPRLWVSVLSLQPIGLEKLVEAMTAKGQIKRSLGIETNSQSVARKLRKMAPQWLFEADASQMLRLHTFASLWIETVMDFWADIVVVGKQDEGLNHVSPRELRELRRRHKLVFWVDPQDPATMTTRPE